MRPGTMGCLKCMDHKPRVGAAFTCPVCGQRWVLAGVGPGNYYEPHEKHEEERTHAERVLAEVKGLDR